MTVRVPERKPVARHYITYIVKLPDYTIPYGTQPFEDREDLQAAIDQAPDGTIGFYFHSVWEMPVTVSVNGEDKEVLLKSDSLDLSKTYYIDGELFTVDQIEQLSGHLVPMAQNMRANCWTYSVRCRHGAWMPWDENWHALVSSKPNPSPNPSPSAG